MADLQVNLGKLTLTNPLVTCSGTFGFGSEYADVVPLEKLGAITVKGISSRPAPGNRTPRIAEVHSGMLNAIGLQNPGVEKFINAPEYLPSFKKINTPLFVNIWGKTLEEYIEVARRLNQTGEQIAALEINISCPNIKEGGMAFGTDLDNAARVVENVRKATSLPLITKLSPNVTRIDQFAHKVVDAGTDIISLINTIPAMSIDIESQEPSLANTTGGLSGPAIKPIAVRMVYEAAHAVDVPIIGMGGVTSGDDVVEFMLAGADAVGVGTSIFSNPGHLMTMLDELDQYLDNHGFNSAADLTGAVKTS